MHPIKYLTLWDFSLLLYAKPQVAEFCLYLQDTYDVDVNVFLWAIWLQQQQIYLTPPKLTLALERVQPWNTQYVQPLRNLRRQMKLEFIDKLEQVMAVREHIKQAELLAERQEQRWLQELSKEWYKDASSYKAGYNIQLYLKKQSVPHSVILQAEVLCLSTF